MHLLQIPMSNGKLWMSLSPAARSRVSELSCVTSVFHVDPLVNIIRSLEFTGTAQLGCALRWTDIEMFRQYVGIHCTPSTLQMMRRLILYLNRESML